MVGVGLSRADAAGQSILSALSTMDLCDDVVLAGVVARLREHPVLARTRQMALSWAREAVAALEGLEEATLAGTRERLAGDGIQAQGAQSALAEAGERARVVRDAMEQFAHLLVDRAA